jgi:hypothetical protein
VGGPALAAAGGGGGVLPWVLAGLVAGLAIGFAYAAVRRFVERRRR